MGAERTTAWAVEELAGLVEERYDAGRGPTVVTSNYAPAALARRLGGRDPVVGERIVSRLVDGAVFIQVAGPNMRVPAAPDEPGVPHLRAVSGGTVLPATGGGWQGAAPADD